MKELEVLSFVLDGNKTGKDITDYFGLSRNQFYQLKDKLRLAGTPLIYDQSTKTYSVKTAVILTEEELQVARRIGKMGLERQHIDRVLEALAAKRIPREYREIVFSKDVIRFIIISDLHCGSKFYREEVIRRAAAEAKRINADFILNAGDSVDGISGRDGQWLDLEPEGMGITAQAKYLAEELAHFGEIPVYSIEALNSHSGYGWSNHKGAIGLNVGEYFELMSGKYGTGNYKFIGFNKGQITINGIHFRLIHLAKGNLIGYIHGLTGSHKPHVCISGHWHSKVGYYFERNVHAIDAATAQETTNFIESISQESIVGYQVCELVIGHGATDQTELEGDFVESLSYRFVPFYSKVII